MTEQQDPARRAQLAARIKEARTMAGLSQGQVARMLGLHRPSVSEIEAGNRRVTAEELTRMAEIFDVGVSWLVGEAPDTIAPDDPRLQLAARELGKLKPADLDRLMALLAAMRRSEDDGQGESQP
ncbi:MAG: helix-turn-helix transcriptional regulator [Hyphomicrobiaceae bacterium]|nr:helix-turn-helix transcriptional regulator [Hyphomicrobiaceae bacterium]